MRRLSGADAHFLSEETRTQHSHTIKVQIVDPSTSHRPLTFDEFKRGIQEGLSVIPPFQWRLVSIPLRVAQPRWYYDPNLDLDYHLRRAAVPSPGGEREFAEVISEIASTGLERDRPLWQMWFVEGLAHGYVAFVTKLHHAVADGRSSAQILLDAFQESPDASVAHPPHESAVPETVPPRWRLFLEGLVELAALTLRVPGLIRRGSRARWVRIRRVREGLGRPALPFSGPATRFNRTLTPHRWFANVDVSIADMKRVKGAFGGTLNDVFVAICAGGIRRYLDAHSELPRRPLTAIIPVSIRKEEEKRTYGNRLANWLVSIATDIDDPVERLRAIQRNTRVARDTLQAADPELLSDFMDMWWIYDLCTNKFPKLARRITGRPTYDVILSNVRGPERPMYMEGSRLVALRSMGPIVNDLGLNITGWSYVDTMSIGMVACREHVPDIWDLAGQIPRELARLVAAAEDKEAQTRTDAQAEQDPRTPPAPAPLTSAPRA